MNAQQLKNSILQMAVSGKLVPQDPNDEPASVLLEHIRKKKEQLIKEGKIKKEKKPSYIFRGADNTPYEKVGYAEPVSIADEVPFEIPDSWEWCRASSLGNMIRGKGIKRTETVSSGYPCVRYGEIYTTYDTSFTETVSFIPTDIDRQSLHFSTGDVIFTLTGENKVDIAKAVAFLGKGTIAAGGDLAFWTAHGMDPLYLVYYMASPYCIEQKRRTATGDIIVHISTSKVGDFLVPVPPIQEQHRIVEQIKEIEPLLKQYCNCENKLTTLNSAFPEQLKKSILQLAVQGKLVPQDPADEPASVLLKRIREEKERLIKEGKIKCDKNESVIFRRDNSHYEKLGFTERCIDDEIPYDLPDSWMWCRMSSLFSINPRNQLSDDTDVGFMPMPLLEDGFRNKHSFEKRKWGDVKSGFTHFKNGDVVIAKITPCFQNRKSAVIIGLPNGYGAGTTELHVLRDETQILFMPYFLLCCKTHDFITGGIMSFSGTAGQQRVGKDYISKYLIPLPPVQEQVRIVEAAKSILTSLDELL